MPTIIAGLASLALASAYVVYIVRIARGEIPHPITITIWMVWVSLNRLTYQHVASPLANWFPAVQQLCITALFLLTVLAITRHGWSRVRRVSTFGRWQAAMGLALIAAVVYVEMAPEPRLTNLIAQPACALSFVPYVTMAFAGRQRMSHWPWSLGVVAYGLQLVVAWPDGWLALVYPAINIVGHGAVWYGTQRPRHRMEG